MLLRVKGTQDAISNKQQENGYKSDCSHYSFIRLVLGAFAFFLGFFCSGGVSSAAAIASSNLTGASVNGLSAFFFSGLALGPEFPLLCILVPSFPNLADRIAFDAVAAFLLQRGRYPDTNNANEIPLLLAMRRNRIFDLL